MPQTPRTRTIRTGTTTPPDAFNHRSLLTD